MQLYFRRKDLHDTKRLLIFDLLSLACDVIAHRGSAVLEKTRADELIIEVSREGAIQCKRIVFTTPEDAANTKFVTPGTDNPWLELQEGKKNV